MEEIFVRASTYVPDFIFTDTVKVADSLYDYYYPRKIYGLTPTETTGKISENTLPVKLPAVWYPY